MLNFQLNLIQKAYLINLKQLILEKYLLKENFYDFSVDRNAVHESDILSIYEYLMAKNNIK